MNAAEMLASTQEPATPEMIEQMLEGYRFSVCTTAEAARRALEVRRAVYVDGYGYDIPVPDPVDARSWFLLAEEVATGRAVGTLRLTPRWAGPLELEQYFRLPRGFKRERSVEQSRFAIVRDKRKKRTLVPAVSFGIFALNYRFALANDTQYLLLATKPGRAWTYQWMRFTSTGIRSKYEGLGDEDHELMFGNLERADVILEGHPFRAVFSDVPLAQVEVPETIPPLGLGIEEVAEPFRVAVGA